MSLVGSQVADQAPAGEVSIPDPADADPNLE